MEEEARNDGFSGGAIKNRNSAGCLIVKEKVDVGGYSGPDIVYERKKKKRPRLVESDSESSDDELLEIYRRRTGSNQVSTSSTSTVYKKGTVRESEFGRKKGVNFARNEGFPEERKRNTLDVYDFDEYDDLDDVDNRYSDTHGSGRIFVGGNPVMGSGGRRMPESGSNRHAIMSDRRRPFLESTSSKKIRAGNSSVDGRFDIKSKLPIPVLKERFEPSSDEAIRLQGKNGVLKLMVKNKKVGGPSIAQNYEKVEGSSMSRSGELGPKNSMMDHSIHLKKKVLNSPNTIDQRQIDKLKPIILLPSKSSDDSDEQSEESEEPPRTPSSDAKTCRPTKRGRSETGVTPSPDRFKTSRLKSHTKGSGGAESKVKRGSGTESKVKRGNGTEKQLLREKIRNMLVSAGWTIDYRPRRNRDYFDAVYINPAGTAYWSIIKAYDALQKQLEEEGAKAGGECSTINLISDDVLSKLTRQTQKKLEKELKRKKREDNKTKQKEKAATGQFVNDDPETESTDSGSEEEKLSSFIKQSCISKGRLLEFQNGNGRRKAGSMQERTGKPSAGSFHVIHGRETKKIGRCTLLVRNADKGLNSEGNGFVPYKGKRTLLSWLIDSGTVKLSEKVLYMNRRRSRVMLEGWITRDGIHCGCCSKILTVSKFEIHAASKLRQPYQNICLPSGVSLLECQLDAWNSQDDSLRRGFHEIDVDGDDPDDDTCGICGDGGNLICCDGCPSTFHQNCVGIEMLPPGDWHCPHCSCKFCGLTDVDSSQRNEKTSNELDECSLCERKYHKSCIQEKSFSRSSNSQISFCGRKCKELFEQLQKFLGVKHELESGLSWSLVHRTDLDTDPSHRGFSQKVEWNAKLAVALTVMDECFLPITDRRSGINLIQNVIYNCRSNFNRLNYGGFYTAILERGDEIICAASIRIHGIQLAEMPFIGTRHIYRRQGMCRRLLFAIESALRSLKVEKLIIPAISDMMHTWTKVFGFSALEETHKQEMKSLNMLVFPGIDLLEKNLEEQGTSKRDIAACTDSCKDDGVCSPLPDLTKGSDMETSLDQAGSSDPLPHNDLLSEKSDEPQNDHIVEKSDAGFPLQGSGASSKLEDKLVKLETESSIPELEDKLVKTKPNGIKVDWSLKARNDTLGARKSSVDDLVKHNQDASTEGGETDRQGNKVASADLGLEAFDGSIVGNPVLGVLMDGSQENKQGSSDDLISSSFSAFAEMPESALDVKKPSLLGANHETILMRNPVLNSPTDNNIQAVEVDADAPLEINDKTSEGDPTLKDTIVSALIIPSHLDDTIESEPLSTRTKLDSAAEDSIHPQLDSAAEDSIQPHSKSELDAVLVINGKTSDSGSTLEASGASTLPTLLCSDVIDESVLQSGEVQAVDHSQTSIC